MIESPKIVRFNNYSVVGSNDIEKKLVMSHSEVIHDIGGRFYRRVICNAKSIAREVVFPSAYFMDRAVYPMNKRNVKTNLHTSVRTFLTNQSPRSGLNCVIQTNLSSNVTNVINNILNYTTKFPNEIFTVTQYFKLINKLKYYKYYKLLT